MKQSKPSVWDNFLNFDEKVKVVRNIVIVEFIVSVVSFFLGMTWQNHNAFVSEKNQVIGLLTQVVEFEKGAIANNEKYYDSYSMDIAVVLNDKVSVEMYQNIIKEDDVFTKVDSNLYTHIYQILEFANYLDEYAKLDTTSDADKITAYKWRDGVLQEVNELVLLACEDLKTNISDDKMDERINAILKEYAEKFDYQITVK